MAVFFESETEDPDRVMDAMTAFGDLWAEADTAALVPDLQVSADAGAVEEVFGFIRSNWPYFLTEADYARMDSLLAVPGYVEARMADNERSFYSMGSSFTSQYLRSDPLGLFSPVLQRLEALNPATKSRVEDGFLFTGDGRTGVVLFNSPFGSTGAVPGPPHHLDRRSGGGRGECLPHQERLLPGPGPRGSSHLHRPVAQL